MVTLGQTILPQWVGADQQVNTNWMAKVGQGTRVSVFSSKSCIIMLNRIHVEYRSTCVVLMYNCAESTNFCELPPTLF